MGENDWNLQKHSQRDVGRSRKSTVNAQSSFNPDGGSHGHCEQSPSCSSNKLSFRTWNPHTRDHFVIEIRTVTSSTRPVHWERPLHTSIFWSRWKKEFLPILQPRRKWQTNLPNLKEGDVVLLQNKEAGRNDWPLALVAKAYPSDDGKVRKVNRCDWPGYRSQDFAVPSFVISCL